MRGVAGDVIYRDVVASYVCILGPMGLGGSLHDGSDTTIYLSVRLYMCAALSNRRVHGNVQSTVTAVGSKTSGRVRPVID